MSSERTHKVQEEAGLTLDGKKSGTPIHPVIGCDGSFEIHCPSVEEGAEVLLSQACLEVEVVDLQTHYEGVLALVGPPVERL